ncbi:MAG: BLUF domain-containing protein [Actinomycetota bacterium]
MSEDLHALLYVSTAEVPFTSTDLVELTSTSSYANESRQITGYLWFDGSMFLQYLEGPSNEVDQLEARIRDDERHTIVKMFRRSIPAAERRFEGWSMRLMNANERFEMHMEGVLVALLEIPQGSDEPRARSAWALTDRLSAMRSA